VPQHGAPPPQWRAPAQQSRARFRRTAQFTEATVPPAGGARHGDSAQWISIFSLRKPAISSKESLEL